MDRDAVIAQTASFVRRRLEGDSSGHDWWHIDRVRRLAAALGREERADLFVVELAALLHDIDDWKMSPDGSHEPVEASEWLASIGLDETIAAHVCGIIRDLSFKGAGVPTPMRTIEGKVVQDADRLDAMGAVGIARAFAYGGHKGRALHDPAIRPERHDSFEAYKKGAGPTINHFHEKLLLLKDLMGTKTAKALAAERHAFMEAFLAEFHEEWEGRR